MSEITQSIENCIHVTEGVTQLLQTILSENRPEIDNIAALEKCYRGSEAIATAIARLIDLVNEQELLTENFEESTAAPLYDTFEDDLYARQLNSSVLNDEPSNRTNGSQASQRNRLYGTSTPLPTVGDGTFNAQTISTLPSVHEGTFDGNVNRTQENYETANSTFSRTNDGVALQRNGTYSEYNSTAGYEDESYVPDDSLSRTDKLIESYLDQQSLSEDDTVLQSMYHILSFYPWMYEVLRDSNLFNQDDPATLNFARFFDNYINRSEMIGAIYDGEPWQYLQGERNMKENNVASVLSKNITWIKPLIETVRESDEAQRNA